MIKCAISETFGISYYFCYVHSLILQQKIMKYLVEQNPSN